VRFSSRLDSKDSHRFLFSSSKLSGHVGSVGDINDPVIKKGNASAEVTSERNVRSVVSRGCGRALPFEGWGKRCAETRRRGTVLCELECRLEF